MPTGRAKNINVLDLRRRVFGSKKQARLGPKVRALISVNDKYTQLYSDKYIRNGLRDEHTILSSNFV